MIESFLERMEDSTMPVVVESLNNAGQASQVGLWLVALLMLGLSVMVWLTLREVHLNSSRLSSFKAHVPTRENLTTWSRYWLVMRVLLRGREFREIVEPATSQGDTGYEIRLRREIDKLVGKEVYHGQKEQL